MTERFFPFGRLRAGHSLRMTEELAVTKVFFL